MPPSLPWITVRPTDKLNRFQDDVLRQEKRSGRAGSEWHGHNYDSAFHFEWGILAHYVNRLAKNIGQVGEKFRFLSVLRQESGHLTTHFYKPANIYWSKPYTPSMFYKRQSIRDTVQFSTDHKRQALVVSKI